ncbi:MAG: hypothetical protein K8T10_19940 [Candidatus Eremiobacteraeota bacterium]|nr:hypothetical protein [Candidatus Eremiobacteraeota bacterium]
MTGNGRGKFTIKIQLLSDTLVGSGEGWGSYIDSDVVFDELCIPYIPARRIKGCLRESAQEIAEFLTQAKFVKSLKDDIVDILGEPGKTESSPLIIDNLYPDDYQELKEWIKWGMEEFPLIVSREAIRDCYTVVRQQTAIETGEKEKNDKNGQSPGVAKEGSLRTLRAIKKGGVFEGEINLCNVGLHEKAKNLLALASANFLRMGTNRNRGLGEVFCTIENEGSNISDDYESIINKLYNTTEKGGGN